MAPNEISVKKYVVRLSGAERQQVETLIRKGKGPARGPHFIEGGRLGGESWSDIKIIDALDTARP